MDKACILKICVDICLAGSEEYIQVLIYLSSCYDKTASFFALLPGLEIRPCFCTTAKVFEHSHSVFPLCLP